MPLLLLIFSQLGYLIQSVAINSHTWWQTVQIQISWLLKKPTDLDLHCLQFRVYLASAGQGLTYMLLLHATFYKITNKYYCIQPNYHMWHNYRTYPCKRTVKQFHSLQVTASVLFVYFFFLKRQICYGYPFELHQLVNAIQISTHNIRFKTESQTKKTA